MRGVFWIVEGELKAYVFEPGSEYGVAKSGVTFNHKLLWPHVRPAKCKKELLKLPEERSDAKTKNRFRLILQNLRSMTG